jgi:small-conductance mechanosensitive channel
MMMNQFLDSNSSTQVILMLATFAVAWLTILNMKPSDSALQSLHIEKVTFLLSLVLIAFFESLFYFAITSVWPRAMLAVQYLCLNFATLTILAICPGSRLLRIFGAILVGVIISLLQNTSLNQEWAGIPFKPANLLRGWYSFISAFIILYYYGQVYRIWHECYPSSHTLDTSAVNYLIVLLAVVIAATVGLIFAGVDVASLSLPSSLVVGALALVFQDTLRSAFHGISLIIGKSIKTGDVITINGTKEGRVLKITPQHTVLRDWNGIVTLIPNSSLASSTIINWSHAIREEGTGCVRINAEIGVAYETNLTNASMRLARAARRVKGRVLAKPSPQVQISGPGDSAINLQVGFWISDPENGISNVRSQVYREILDECNREPKITIPFPQREIRIIGAPEERRLVDLDALGPSVNPAYTAQR